MHHRGLRFAVITGCVLGVAAAARAVDVPVTGVKLIIVDKTVAASKAKAVFLSKDAAVTKGAGTDAALIEATLDVAYDSVSGQFVMPQGANWVKNSATVAKYVNGVAPTGGAVKVSVIKPGSQVKVVGKSLGDTPIDISSAPTGAVYVADTIVNDGEETRLCTQFAACTHAVIAGGTGYKIICKGNSTGDPTCAAASPATTTTITSSTTSTTVSGGLDGPAFPPVGGTVQFGFTGAARDPGGADVSLFSFTPTTWTTLYWGPFGTNVPAAGLDGSNHVLSTFLGISGGNTVATWEGTSPWTDPGNTVHNVPIRFTLTIIAGGLTFESSTGVPGLDPGPGTGIDVAINVAPSGTATNFTTNWAFTADIPTDANGFIPLSQVPGGLTSDSFGGGFYSQP